MNRLVNASSYSLRLLEQILGMVKSRNNNFTIRKSNYYASIKSPDTNRNFCYLPPQAKQIRIFLRLTPTSFPELEETPSTNNWRRFTVVKNGTNIERIVDLIIESYNNDRIL